MELSQEFIIESIKRHLYKYNLTEGNYTLNKVYTLYDELTKTTNCLFNVNVGYLSETVTFAGWLSAYPGGITKVGLFAARNHERHVTKHSFILSHEQKIRDMQNELAEMHRKMDKMCQYIDILEHSPDPGPKYLAAKEHFENTQKA